LVSSSDQSDLIKNSPRSKVLGYFLSLPLSFDVLTSFASKFRNFIFAIEEFHKIIVWDLSKWSFRKWLFRNCEDNVFSDFGNSFLMWERSEYINQDLLFFVVRGRMADGLQFADAMYRVPTIDL